MSRALVQAGQLKPEIRLAQAVSEFKEDLSTHEKALLESQQHSPPSSEDVMRITASLNKTSANSGIRRCYGPRLTTFLEGVQSFVPIGDTLIGGTQGWLGRGVWTAVRFSIQSVTGSTVQHATHLDKLTSVFMEAGRSMPRHQNMALLFPQSKVLQAHLTEYFIVVVKLCHKLMTMFRSSGLQQLWDSYSNPLEAIEAELKNWSAAINDELMIQSVAMVKAEKEENAISRFFAQRDRDARDLRTKEKHRLRLLQKFSQYNHQTIWKQTRKEGTTSLFLADESYLSWKKSTRSCTHVFSGKLGSGKSVLLANLVDDLYMTFRPGQRNITYFFCHHRSRESLMARTVIGSIARQLFHGRNNVQDFIQTSLEDSDEWDIEDIVRVIKKAMLRSPNPIYIVIDGLDECQSYQRKYILDTINTLQQSIRILFCISMRWEPNQNPIAQLSGFHNLTSYKIPEDNPDISAFINAETEARIASGHLILSYRDIIPVLKATLTSKSEGMFLWVVLSLDMLCMQSADNDILQALQSLPLPQKLPELYSRLLNRGTSVTKDYQEAILQLVAIARRPLTIKELQEALSVEIGNTEWNQTRLVNNMSTLLGNCAGLVILDEEELTLRFVHDSARQYLMDADCVNSFSFKTSDAELRMAQILATYLNYVVFETQVSTKVVPKINAEPIIQKVLASTGSASVLTSLASRFGRLDAKLADQDIAKVLADTAMRARASIVPTKLLEAYAKDFWYIHCAAVLGIDPLTTDLVTKLLSKGMYPTVLSEQCSNPISWTASKGFAAALHLLLTKSWISVDHTECYNVEFRRALYDAAARGDTSTIRAYLQCPSAVKLTEAIAPQPNGGDSLWVAAASHNEGLAVFQLLLEYMPLDSHAWRLIRACLHGSETRSSEVLTHDDDLFRMIVTSSRCGVNQRYGELAQTPLMYAISNRLQRRIDVLLSQPSVRFNIKDGKGRTALSYAAGLRRIDNVKALVLRDRSACELVDDDGFTPLMHAASTGSASICQFLLEQYDNLDETTKDGDNALLLAVRNGHQSVVAVLLKFGADRSLTQLRQIDQAGRTALSYAAELDSHKILEMLWVSDWKANVMHKCSKHRTVLSYAAQSKNIRSVRLVLLMLDNSWKEKEHTDDLNKTPLDYCNGDDLHSLRIHKELVSSRHRG